MSTVKAYLTSNYTVVLSKGQAKDKGRGYYREVFLHYEGDLDGLVKNNEQVWFITDTISNPSLIESISKHFYFNREEAIEAAKKAGLEDAGVWNCHGVVIEDNDDYKPVQLPVRAIWAQGEKGLFCRLHLHPEEDGWGSNGKVFFPDRVCAGKLCTGPVIIQSVKDKGNYGFFTGEMVQYKAPTDEQMAEYVIQNDLYDFKVRFMSGLFGSYVHIFGVPGAIDCFVQAADGNVEKNYDMTEYGEAASYCTEAIQGVDLVCQGFQGCDFEEFYGRFVLFDFGAYRASHSIKFISKLFDEAIKYRFISLKTTNNVDFVEVDKKQLMYALDQFSREEMAEIIAKVNEINNKANEAIRSKVRSGKVRLY